MRYNEEKSLKGGRYASKEAFFAHVDACDGTVEHIQYEENTATVTLKGE